MAVFTQRVVALVELTGGQADQRRFEDECDRRGWAVLERPEENAGAQRNVSADVRYVVELRQLGIAWRAAAGANEQVKEAARRLDLAARVLTADRMVTDGPAQVFEWRPVTARSWRLGGTSRPPMAGRRMWAADEQEALRLARRALPGAAPTPSGVRVSSESLADAHSLANRRNVKLGAIIWFALNLVAYGNSTALSALRVVSAPRAAVSIGSVVAGCWLTQFSVRRPWAFAGELKPLGGAFLTLALCLLAAALGVRTGPGGWEAGPVGEQARTLVAIAWLLLRIALVLGGLFLLGYSSGWRTLAPWLIPFAIPVIIGLVPGAGEAVVRQYLDAFGTEPDDVGVPLYWQFRASAPMLLGLTPWLLMPAIFLGYLRLLHVPLRSRGVMTVSCIVALLMGYVTLSGSLLDSARRDGRQAEKAAADWRTPPPFYGITPSWVCAAPLAGDDPARIPVVGGIFSPGRAYLMLGDSAGTAVLWAPSAAGTEGAETLQVPLAKVRIRDADAPASGCT
ncbi:hypothetical protein ACIQPR_44075 [Streptomyces sp. NPDC091280]|uniref:hypothetical protein n=1 Tax=Streptomyces sp. NPDC091280 TaxID=3365984 RepID=UPI0038191F77